MVGEGTYRRAPRGVPEASRRRVSSIASRSTRVPLLQHRAGGGVVVGGAALAELATLEGHESEELRHVRKARELEVGL